MPRLEVRECPLEAILGMRDDYRRGLDVQIVHYSWHQRGSPGRISSSATDSRWGYGAVDGAPRETPDVVKENYREKSDGGSSRPFAQRP